VKLVSDFQGVADPVLLLQTLFAPLAAVLQVVFPNAFPA
jgi:hypothetical protein